MMMINRNYKKAYREHNWSNERKYLFVVVGKKTVISIIKGVLKVIINFLLSFIKTLEVEMMKYEIRQM